MFLAQLMKYQKPALSYAEQADLLLSRGLVADRLLLIERLKVVNYYRITGYLHTFRMLGPDGRRMEEYQRGTTFDTVWRRYCFDRRLKLLTLDGIERIEIALKTKITQDFSLKYGPFGYLELRNLPRLSSARHQDFLTRLREETRRSREDFVLHFLAKYGDQHAELPLWMAVEVMSYGSILTLFNGMAQQELKGIATEFKVTLPLLESWVSTLNSIRNICAHHARLWNRELGIKPKIPLQGSFPEWHLPVPTPANRMFSVLTIIRYLLGQVAPQSGWHGRLLQLLAEYPELPLRFMGFPDNWREHALWQDRQRRSDNV